MRISDWSSDVCSSDLGNPDHRRYAGVLGGDADLHRGVEVHGVVLHVDEQPVVAGGAHGLGDVDGARLAQPAADGELSGPQPVEGGVLQVDHGSLRGADAYGPPIKAGIGGGVISNATCGPVSAGAKLARDDMTEESP